MTYKCPSVSSVVSVSAGSTDKPARGLVSERAQEAVNTLTNAAKPTLGSATRRSLVSIYQDRRRAQTRLRPLVTASTSHGHLSHGGQTTGSSHGGQSGSSQHGRQGGQSTVTTVAALMAGVTTSADADCIAKPRTATPKTSDAKKNLNMSSLLSCKATNARR